MLALIGKLLLKLWIDFVKGELRSLVNCHRMSVLEGKSCSDLVTLSLFFHSLAFESVQVRRSHRSNPNTGYSTPNGVSTSNSNSTNINDGTLEKKIAGVSNGFNDGALESLGKKA